MMSKEQALHKAERQFSQLSKLVDRAIAWSACRKAVCCTAQVTCLPAWQWSVRLATRSEKKC